MKPTRCGSVGELERQDRGHSTVPTHEEIAAAIDPVISFVRAGLQALPDRTR